MTAYDKVDIVFIQGLSIPDVNICRSIVITTVIYPEPAIYGEL